MASLKLTNQIVKLIVKRIRRNEFKRDIIKKYKIGRSAFTTATKKAIAKGFMKEKEYLKWKSQNICRGFERKVEKHGIKKAIKIVSDAGRKSFTSDPKRFREMSRKGGRTVQRVAPHVRGNLVYHPYVSYPRYSYNGAKFSSKDERFTGGMLLAFNVIRKIQKGKNYQVKFGKKKVDFLVKRKIDGKVKKIAVEYHPIPRKSKNHKQFGKHKNMLEYKRERKDMLKKAGFKGDLFIIANKGDVYDFLKKYDYNTDNFPRKQRGVKEKIFNEDTTIEGLLKGKVKRIKNRNFYLLDKKLPTNQKTSIFKYLEKDLEINKVIGGIKKIPLNKVMFMDIETCGFGHKKNLYLIGTARYYNKNLHVNGIFARNRHEEKAALLYFASQLKNYEMFITWNGISFDVPFLKARARTNYVDLEERLKQTQHLDLMKIYKKSRKIKLSSYSMKTIERVLLKYKRKEEVNSREIESIYNNYVITKDATDVNKIITRNFEDLYTTFRALFYYIKKEHNNKRKSK